jgi:hypothetical protein
MRVKEVRHSGKGKYGECRRNGITKQLSIVNICSSDNTKGTISCAYYFNSDISKIKKRKVCI